MPRPGVRPRRSQVELQKAYLERMHRRFHGLRYMRGEKIPFRDKARELQEEGIVRPRVKDDPLRKRSLMEPTPSTLYAYYAQGYATVRPWNKLSAVERRKLGQSVVVAMADMLRANRERVTPATLLSKLKEEINEREWWATEATPTHKQRDETHEAWQMNRTAFGGLPIAMNSRAFWRNYLRFTDLLRSIYDEISYYGKHAREGLKGFGEI
ncbi:MAG: hypothetical protein IPJ89_05635 [Candidatus Iainarchaeum archaeon]|uniref:Uncharacterized protein n=1 Tax=Candidatus Iainarchaeum sp. TaxID=3101447 RepID=A0A7T9DJQ1_9ARCH|nr:MAG: hypothetical protein IPJ89_05635 [Candidatus Diapherotrites archaeon]